MRDRPVEDGASEPLTRAKHQFTTKGIEPQSDLAKYVNARESDGYTTVTQILKMSPSPDAIFTSNGLLAAGALRAILDSKRAIPDEIVFASFDDTPWSRLVVPAITVIEQPTYEIGQHATFIDTSVVKTRRI
jgi:LacI family fructose operon transcriptional repressor